MAFTVTALAGGHASASIARIGSYLQISAGNSGEMHADIAYDNKHGVYLAAWGDGGSGAVRPVWALLITRDGAAVGPTAPLTSCPGELYGQRTKVAYSAGSTDDVFLVLYKEWCGGVVQQFAHLLRYSPAGIVSIGRVAIAGDSNPGDVVYNPQRGEFMAVFEQINGGLSWDALYRPIPLARDGNGTVVGFGAIPAAGALSGVPEVQGLPTIALDPTSQSYFIAFQGEDPFGPGLAMMAKTMNAATYALSELFYVARGGYTVESSVIFLPDIAQFVVFWRQDSDIVGRRFLPISGAPTTNAYPVVAQPDTDGGGGSGYDAGTHVGLVAGMNGDYWSWGSEIDGAGNPVSSFRASSAPPTPPGGGTFFPKIAATGDGQLAMIYGTDYTKVNIDRFATAGGGTPPSPPPPSPPPPSPPSPPPPPPSTPAQITAAKADFTEDGTADLLWQHANGYIGLWQMIGSNVVRYLSLGQGVDPAWRLAGSGDLDGNWSPEIVWQHKTTGQLVVWAVDGGLVYKTASLNPGYIETAWKIAAIADLSGDGKADIIWQHDSGLLAIWYMNGVNRVGSDYLSPNAAAAGWKLVGAGDINGDLMPDLIWYRSDGYIGAWIMNGRTATTWSLLSIPYVDTAWTPRSVVDLNNDGIADIAWQHRDGWVGWWAMRGYNVQSTQLFNPSKVGTEWTLAGPR